LIVVLDYGINNLRSVVKAVEYLGFDCRSQTDLRGATKLLIPGVGAFAKAMTHLAPLKNEIRAFAEAGGPLLGICLGQQLLFETSEEFEDCEGLGLIPGRVKYLPANSGLKVPHMGWSTVSRVPAAGLFTGLAPTDRFYFVHSLYTECADSNHVAATCRYGVDFPAAVQSKNVYGVQFHPEKSGETGLALLRNFLTC
jgi:glutamine amidotransferase